MIKEYFRKMLGGEKSPSRTPHHKIGWSWLGAFIGIYIVSTIHNWLHIDTLNSLFLVGSFGASAVLSMVHHKQNSHSRETWWAGILFQHL